MIKRIDEPTGEEAYLAMEITRRRLEFEKTLEPLVKRMTELQRLRMPVYKISEADIRATFKDFESHPEWFDVVKAKD